MDREPASSTPQAGARPSKRSRPEDLPETDLNIGGHDMQAQTAFVATLFQIAA